MGLMTLPPAVSVVSWAPTASETPGHDGDRDDDTFQSWSSLIGIITAIVGNILIALALNVQRYAHTRLHKQRVRVRRKARAALKRSQSGNGTRSYGAIRESPASNGRDRTHAHSNGNDNINTEDDRARYPAEESEPLTASFLSGASTEADADGDEDETKVASTYLKSPYWWLGQILITLGEMGNFLAYGFAPASIVSPLGVVALISNCIIAPVMFHEMFRQRDFWGVVVATAGVVTVVLSADQEEVKLDPHAVWDAITSLQFEVYLGVTVGLIILLMWASTKYGRQTILIDLGLVGLFGGYTALATKGVSSMLSFTLWRAFATPVTYVLIVILLGTAIMQIRYVNKALQRFDSTQVIPIQFVMFTLCVILGSAILYGDFEHTNAEQAAKFVGGCLLTFFGVFLITSGRQAKGDEDDVLSEADGVEETIGMAHQEGNPQEIASATTSRRSSRLSRVSFADTIRGHADHQEGGSPVPRPRVADNSPGPVSLENAPLLEQPWQDAWNDATDPPRAIRTLSADSAMLAASTATAPTGASAGPITSPTTEGLSQPTYPTDRPSTPRPPLHHARSTGHFHRSAGTFISPSPLSSTVTAVVKDAFLREGDDRLPRQSSMRRFRSSIRNSLFFGDGDESNMPQPIVPVSDGDLARLHESSGVDHESGPARPRARSLSETLGHFFRSKKKREDVDDERQTEHGP